MTERYSVTEIVLSIIKKHFETNPKAKYITTSTIISEARNTSLGGMSGEFYTHPTRDRLESAVQQALSNLRKSHQIERAGDKKGYYKLVKTRTPKNARPLCKWLQKEYEVYCSSCGQYSYALVSKEKAFLPCSHCKNKNTTKRFFRFYCPIKKKYIGSPEIASCGLLQETDYAKIGTGKIGGAIRYTAFCPDYKQGKET